MRWVIRFAVFFGGGLAAALVPLVFAVIGEDGRPWDDVVYSGSLILIAVGIASGALMEALAANSNDNDGWHALRVVAGIAAALIVLLGAMLYAQYSDNDVQRAAYDLNPSLDEPPTPSDVVDQSYLITLGALLAGIGSTVASEKGKDKA